MQRLRAPALSALYQTLLTGEQRPPERFTVYLTDLGLSERMSRRYRSFFAGPNLPARTCVGVSSLLSGGLIEIDCVARMPDR